jgi:hypothetical protein
MNRAMYRKLTMLAVAALLSLFALEENAADPPAKAPLSGVLSVLSIDDSPRTTHP